MTPYDATHTTPDSLCAHHVARQPSPLRPQNKHPPDKSPGAAPHGTTQELRRTCLPAGHMKTPSGTSRGSASLVQNAPACLTAPRHRGGQANVHHDTVGDNLTGRLHRQARHRVHHDTVGDNPMSTTTPWGTSQCPPRHCGRQPYWQAPQASAAPCPPRHRGGQANVHHDTVGDTPSDSWARTAATAHECDGGLLMRKPYRRFVLRK